MDIILDEITLERRVDFSQNRSSTSSWNTGKQQVNLGSEPMDISQSRKVKCFKCKRYGHSSNECRVRVNTIDTPTYECYTCGGQGHYSRDCPNNRRPKGHGYTSMTGSNRPGQNFQQAPRGRGRYDRSSDRTAPFAQKNGSQKLGSKQEN